MGSKTKQALERKKAAEAEEQKRKEIEEETKKREQFKEVKQIVTTPLANLLDNLYPYGYDNSIASKSAEEKIPIPAFVYDKLGFENTDDASEKLGKLYGAVVKGVRGITGTDKAGNAVNEYVDLDLSNPANYAKADSLLNIIRTEEPKYGPHYGSREDIQFKFRGRKDLNSLHTNRDQKYGTYSQEYGYKLPDGTYTWAFADNEKNKKEAAFMRKVAKNRMGKVTVNSDGTTTYDLKDGGDPYAQHGGFNVYDDGTYLYVADPWNFGGTVKGKEIDTDHYPLTYKTNVGIKVKK